MLQLGQRRFRRGVALQPLFLNDILLFISLEKERECSPRNPKPVLSGLDGSHLSLLQIAVYSCCFVWLWWKHFPPLGRRSAVVACPLRTGTEPSAHLPPLSLWLSDHLFAVICPLCHDAEKESILEAPTEFHQHKAESHRHTKEQQKKIDGGLFSHPQPCCVWPQHIEKQLWTVF